MQHLKRPMITLAALIALVLIASACASEPEVIEKEVTREVITEVTREVVQEVTVQVPQEVTVVVEKEVTVEVEVPAEPVASIPFADLWVSSGHADAEAEAFRHWDEDDPAVVPASCAKCHSTYGYQDFLGIDGTQAGVVDNDAAIDSVIECVACHNEATEAMSSVVFPSGVEMAKLGPEARCMQCHQGRASKASVDNAIAEAGLTDEDTASEDLGFTNIHYFAAAATQAGGTAEGGYQYDGKTYDSKFVHVAGYDTCVGCHDPHTLELRIQECATCHTDVASVEDLKDVRMQGSLVDYDGDGDLEEGIYYEVEGLRDMLYEAIQAYGNEVSGTPIIYDPNTHPYFFLDPNANGEVDEGEADRANAYNAWTARLAKAAYNYQTSLKDPGAFAHGGKYIIQLLYDSIESLNEALSVPIDLSTAHRIDDGHFAGSEEAFRHWDEDGEVSASCSKCHSADGLPMFIKEGVTIAQPTANGFLCSTCHDSLTELTRYPVEEVEFPSGASLDSGNPDSNLCMNCHQGRQWTGDVDRAIAGLDPDTPSEDLGFRNVHYLPAAATLFGTEAQGVYEYPDKSYLGRNPHVPAFANCTDCHTAHGLDVKVEACSACHPGVESEEDLRAIRMSKEDFDGDGDASEGIAGEIDTLHEALYAAIQDYAANVAGTPIVYDAHSYPYFFADPNGNGEVDEGEGAYAAWTPRLLQAAYNYQYAAKDPGTFAHNPKYIIQALYDGLESLGTQAAVDMAGMVRPESE